MVFLDCPALRIKVHNRTLYGIPALVIENHYNNGKVLPHKMAGGRSGEMVSPVAHADDRHAIRPGQFDAECGPEAPSQAANHRGAVEGTRFIDLNLMRTQVVFVDEDGCRIPNFSHAMGQPFHIDGAVFSKFLGLGFPGSSLSLMLPGPSFEPFLDHLSFFGRGSRKRRPQSLQRGHRIRRNRNVCGKSAHGITRKKGIDPDLNDFNARPGFGTNGKPGNIAFDHQDHIGLL